MKWQRFGLAVIASIALFLAAPSIVNAEQTTTIGVAPAIIELPAKRGQTIQRDLQVRNYDKDSLPITLQPESFFVKDVLDTTNTNPYDASKWITFKRDHYLFRSEEAKRIPFTITVPKNASPGGHYAYISVRGLSFANSAQQVPTSLVVPEISSAILITVAGDIHESLQIVNKNLFPFRATRNAIVKTEVTVANNGNIHNLITPAVVLVDGSGKEQSINMQSKVVFPGSEAKFSTTWRVPDQVGAMHAYIKLTYGDSGKTIKTPAEKIIVTLPVIASFTMAFVVILIFYLASHQRNLGPAWRALWQKDK